MARGGTGGDAAAGAPSFTRAQKDAISKMGDRVRSLDAQMAALRQAMGGFGDDFDLDAWSAVWGELTPGAVNRQLPIKGGFESIVNNFVELLRTGCTVTGLLPGRRPPAHDVIVKVESEGGLRPRQAERLHQMYRLRTRLQHHSPNVAAAEIHEYVVQLDRHFADMFKTTAAWLKTHGIELS